MERGPRLTFRGRVLFLVCWVREFLRVDPARQRRSAATAPTLDRTPNLVEGRGPLFVGALVFCCRGGEVMVVVEAITRPLLFTVFCYEEARYVRMG